jgi:hypothetical protein
VASSTADAADFTGGNAVAVNAALDALDAFGMIDSYTGRPPHITKVRATIDLRRGEQIADLRSIRAPRTVRPGQRVRLRVTMRRLRGARITRTYTVRIPRDVRPGRRKLTLLSAADANSGQDDLFDEMLNGPGDSSDGPANLQELIGSIRGLAREDGVRGRLDGERFSAFRDAELMVSGSASTRVRVVSRRR